MARHRTKSASGDAWKSEPCRPLHMNGDGASLRRPQRQGGRNSRKDPAAYAILRIRLYEKPPKFQAKSRVCEMRYVTITWRVFYSEFFARRLAVPLVEHEFKARHISLSAPECDRETVGCGKWR